MDLFKNEQEHLHKLKCAELFRNTSGKYTFVCFLCADMTDSFEKIIDHVEKHFALTQSSLNKIEEPEPEPDNEETVETLDPIYQDPHDPSDCLTVKVEETEYLEDYINEEATTTCKLEIILLDKSQPTTNKINSKLPCVVCEKVLSRKDALQRHLQIHVADKKKPIKCRFCGAAITNQLLQHVDKCHNIPEVLLLDENRSKSKENSKLPCIVCENVLSRKDSLQRHLQIHDTDKKSIKCRFCGDTLTVPILQHFDKCLKIPGYTRKLSTIFKCHICGEPFDRKYKLNDHFKVHDGIKCVKCEVCSLSFFSQSGMMAHKRIHNENAKTIEYECFMCHKPFSLKSNLRQHLRRHYGDKPEQCTICGRRFVFPNELKIHSETHNGDFSHQCAECGKVFLTFILLKSHIRLKHVNLNLICATCGKVFANRDAFRKHSKWHSNERNFECDICNKKFKNKINLRTHKELHSNEKRYKCRTCGMAFTQFAAKWYHEKKCIAN